MTVYAYLFEAKSIQSFILATNRLKEIVGGSELVENLTGKLLDDVLASLQAQDKVEFSRRGGGAFYAFSSNPGAIENLAALWPVVVRQYAPDLEFVSARGKGDDAVAAYECAHKELLEDRNRLSTRFPQAGPLVRRNRRTGEPATAFAKTKGGEPESIDAPTRRKLDHSMGSGLAGRLGTRTEQWPLNLSPVDADTEEGSSERGGGARRDFPFPDESRYVGVVHADGNGLGQLLMGIGESVSGKPGQFTTVFREFSDAIARATERSAIRARERTLDPRMEKSLYPARPIVVGGDDLTIIVRADLALEFTRTFLEAFGEESQEALRELKKEHDLASLPDRLTACAGISFVKASQPFYLAHELAEGLCRHAKGRAKATSCPDNETPTALAFHRVTTAMVDDYGEILDREMTAHGVRQTLECYALEAGKGLPTLDDLHALGTVLKSPDFGKGAARELLGLMGRDHQQAIRRYKRWREVAADRDKAGLQAFDEKLASLLSPAEINADLPCSRTGAGDSLSRSPLGDLNTLNAIGGL